MTGRVGTRGNVGRDLRQREAPNDRCSLMSWAEK